MHCNTGQAQHVIKLLIKYLLMHTHMSLTLIGHSQFCSLGPEWINHSQIPLALLIFQFMHAYSQKNLCLAYHMLYVLYWAIGIVRWRRKRKQYGLKDWPNLILWSGFYCFWNIENGQKCIQDISFRHIEWLFHSHLAMPWAFPCTMIEGFTKVFQVACSRTCNHFHHLSP